ncbi:MAG TPA: GntR family transcriptional regulator [Actinoplanes sp.]|jgi:GntR family transcriptional regulator
MNSRLGAKAPKYQRIADELRREIKSGTLAPGDRLPAETALLDRFRASFPSLSLATLREAIKVLRAEGLVESRHGIGTFVVESRRLQRRSRHRYGRARADRKLLTSHFRHEILSAGRALIPDHVAEAAGLDGGAEMIIRRRVLYDKISGKPQEMGASYIPVEIGGGTYLEEAVVVPKALFLCVEELSGQRYAKVVDRWSWRRPDAMESTLLGMSSDAGVVHLVHVARADDNTLLEVSESIWPADRIEIIDEYDVAQAVEGLDGMSDV